MQSFDPIYLQRLIDHELDRGDTQKMLKMAEDHPGLWREMASAFVENQFWQDDIRELHSVDHTENTNSTLADHQSANNGPRISVWLSIAAGLLLSLTVGMLIGRIGNGLLDDSAIAISQDAAGDAQLADGLAVNQLPSLDQGDQTLVNYRPDCHLDLEDTNGNSVFGGEIPLYSLANAEKAGIRLDQSPEIPQELLEQIQRTGYGLAQNVNYISGQFGDGRSFLMPVRTINITPCQ